MTGIILNSQISPSSGVIPTGDVFNVVVRPNIITIKEGEARSLRALGLFENNVWANATNEVDWASLDANIATVDSEGLLTGISVGQIIITASNDGGTFVGQCLVTVLPSSKLDTRDPVGKGVIYYGYGDPHPQAVSNTAILNEE